LGIVAKYLDTIAGADGSWWMNILPCFGDLCSRAGIWVLIATLIAAYSKSQISAALNTFMFFIGMLTGYYIYSAFLFGSFPTSYFLLWGSIALASPFLAAIVWMAKNNLRLAWILPALPMGLLLSLSLAVGVFYIYVSYIEEFIMYAVLCGVFYKNPKQLAAIISVSFIISFIIKQISPFHF
jgi:hypothetical protein